MIAMATQGRGRPLIRVDRPWPEPKPGELRLKVCACGVCRTDLHVIDGDLAERRPGVVPGHEIVGVVEAVGDGVEGIALGDRVGVPWLGRTCGKCRYCLTGAENLCDHAEFTGWSLDGGYAEQAIADARFCLRIPEQFSDAEAAPLLCAGLIGYRAWRAAQAARPVLRIGLYGFGAAAHLLTQLALAEDQEVYAFTWPGDESRQAFARELGCAWAGGSNEDMRGELDAAIIFAPVGEIVPRALKAVGKGGTVVCAGIHMSDIPGFAYADLWQERRLVSIANLTRQDGHDYLALAAEVGLKPTVASYPLAEANQALDDLRMGSFDGAAVLVP